jgi:hypothetical protein
MKICKQFLLLSLFVAFPLCAMEGEKATQKYFGFDENTNPFADCSLAESDETPFEKFPLASPAKSRPTLSPEAKLEKRFTSERNKLEERLQEERRITKNVLLAERNRTENMARQLAEATGNLAGQLAENTETMAGQLAIQVLLIDHRRGLIEETKRAEERAATIKAACEQVQRTTERKFILLGTASGAIAGFSASSGSKVFGSKILGRITGSIVGAYMGLACSYNVAKIDRAAFDLVKE